MVGGGVLALPHDVLRLHLDAVAGADDDVEAGQQRGLTGFLENPRQAEHAAGEVLVVVAVDVLAVHSGGRGVAERDAGDGAGLPAVGLKLVEDGRDQAAVVADVDAAVVRLDAADDLGGALRRVGVGVPLPADLVDFLAVAVVTALALESSPGPWRRAGRGSRGSGRRSGRRSRRRDCRGDRHAIWAIDVADCLVVGRAGDDVAVLGRAVGVVVLEDQAGALALGVDLVRLDDRGRLGGRPVEAVEPDDEDVLDPLARRRPSCTR